MSSAPVMFRASCLTHRACRAAWEFFLWHASRALKIVCHIGSLGFAFGTPRTPGILARDHKGVGTSGGRSFAAAFSAALIPGFRGMCVTSKTFFSFILKRRCLALATALFVGRARVGSPVVCILGVARPCSSDVGLPKDLLGHFFATRLAVKLGLSNHKSDFIPGRSAKEA